MKQLFFILLAILFYSGKIVAQTQAFTISSAYTGLNVDQNKTLAYVSSLPRNGDLKYINWSTQSAVDNSGNIYISLPNENNGLPINFKLLEADFANPSEYALYGKGTMGDIALYVTKQGIGGTIDLAAKSYNLYPLGETKGLLIELSQAKTGGQVCGTSGPSLAQFDYCDDDCGQAVLDVLAMVTTEARQWANNTFGIYSQWFLFMETHNINGAFVNSLVPDKRVRVKIIDYSPDFNIIANLGADLTSFRNSPNAQQLALQNGADIRVLLTNHNYATTSGAFGAIPADQGDPTTINKVVIVDAPFIGTIRYTFAHEVAHHFGCWHSTPTIPGCPNGRSTANGRNTIMANGTPAVPFAPNNTRIQHFSNPDILFAGEATGEVDVRDNAAQIRGAFCEVANNAPDQFSIYFSKGIGPVCPGETYTFSSSINPGICEDPFTLSYGPCATAPYQYEWRISNNPNFVNSQVIGNSQNLASTIYYCPFYLRLTVTSANGLTTTSTRLYNCAPGVVCDRGGTGMLEEEKDGVANVRCSPNPANDQIKVIGYGVGEINAIAATDVTGKTRQLHQINSPNKGEVICDVSKLQPGLWFLHVQGTEKDLTIKFSIIR